MRILSNEDLESCADMGACIDALYAGLQAYAQDNATRRPRIDLLTPTSRPGEFGCFSTMDGVIRGGYYALRVKPDVISWPVVNGVKRRVTYASRPGLYGGLILLFNAGTAELAAIMNDGYVQHMRVGATAGLGAKYLAREDAETVGIYGSGGMARSLAMAFKAVRPIKRIRAYSPTRQNLLAYCDEMSAKLEIEVTPLGRPEDVPRGADIVACCTNAMEPVLKGEWLQPGTHVDRVAGHEFDVEVYRRVGVVGYMLDRPSLDVGTYTDDNFALRTSVIAYLSGTPDERDQIPGNSPGDRAAAFANARWAPCVNWETGAPLAERQPDDITFATPFRSGSGLASGGIQGIQFAAVAGRAYELAAARGLGRELPTGLFLQNIPT